MKKYVLPLFSYLLLIVSLSCKQKEAEISQIETNKKILTDSIILSFEKNLLRPEMDSVFSEYNFNGVISVMQNGELLYEKHNGYKEFKNKLPLNKESVFAIASVSKQFTAVMILQLEEAGKLKTTDSAHTYLDNFNTLSLKNISIENLLNHTSGLSDFGEALLSKPGTEFHYSNKGYRLLGDILEKTSGKSFAENASELFLKAGMKNSFTATMIVNDNFASAFVGEKNQQSEVQNMPARLANKEISSPAGGILSTSGDLHLWQNALYNGKLLTPNSSKKFLKKSIVRDHQTLGKTSYGYGIMIGDGAPTSYFHSGYVKGSPSLVIYYPQTKTSVVILSNISDETKGKSKIFEPHKLVKSKMDAIINAVVATKTVHIQ